VAAVITPIYPDELKISVSRIQAMVDSYRERKRTGIIRLGYPSGKYLHLMLKRGNILACYVVSSGAYEMISEDQWMGWANFAGDAYLKLIPLSSTGLFNSKLLLTSNENKADRFSHPNQILEYISSHQYKTQPSLAHFSWDNAMGCLFFSGAPEDVYSIFISHDTIVDEGGIHKIFAQWNEPNCIVRISLPDLTIASWQEYYLKRTFAAISLQMLKRIETMTGRALIDSLIRLITIYISRNNLDIIFSPHKVADHEVFLSPQQAGQTYRLILDEMFSHFSAVVGSRLLALTLRDIIMSFPEHERAVVRNFQLLPEGYSYE
jgi:hypothetical protein